LVRESRGVGVWEDVDWGKGLGGGGVGGGGIPTYSINRRGKVQPYKYSPVSRGATKILEGREKTGGRGGYIRVITKNFE